MFFHSSIVLTLDILTQWRPNAPQLLEAFVQWSELRCEGVSACDDIVTPWKFAMHSSPKIEGGICYLDEEVRNLLPALEKSKIQI